MSNDCTGDHRNNALEIQMILSGATVVVQILAAMYLCQLTKGAPLTIETCAKAAKVCNIVSLCLMCAIAYFLFQTVYSCYDSPMYSIVLMLVDFMWIGRGMRYKKHARYLRFQRRLAPPLLNRDLEAPEISDDEHSQYEPIAVVAVFAQPVATASHSGVAPLAEAKPHEVWETSVVCRIDSV